MRPVPGTTLAENALGGEIAVRTFILVALMVAVAFSSAASFFVRPPG